MGYAYSTEGQKARERVKGYGSERAERMPGNAPNSEVSGAQRVDTSVRLGDLKGEIIGDVPMERQMAKPQAYVPKKGAP